MEVGVLVLNFKKQELPTFTLLVNTMHVQLLANIHCHSHHNWNSDYNHVRILCLVDNSTSTAIPTS